MFLNFYKIVNINIADECEVPYCIICIHINQQHFHPCGIILTTSIKKVAFFSLFSLFHEKMILLNTENENGKKTQKINKKNRQKVSCF